MKSPAEYDDSNYQEAHTSADQTIAANTWTTVKSLTLTKGVWLLNFGGNLYNNTSSPKYMRAGGKTTNISIAQLYITLSSIIKITNDSQTVTFDVYSQGDSATLSSGASISAVKVGG